MQKTSDSSGSSFILASSSPRRSTLLASAGLTFDVHPSHISEASLPGEAPGVYVRRLAAEKAGDVARSRRDKGDRRLVLGADTVVVMDGARLVGKPGDRAAARQMLQDMSGTEHEVITGFCILAHGGDEHREEVTTRVIFKSLRGDEIEDYLDSGDWRDKAGGYAIQDRAAYMVRTIMGSYTNVVGLPLCQAVEALDRMWDRDSAASNRADRGHG